MKVLQLCTDLFDKAPTGSSINKFFQRMREEHKGGDKSFFHKCIQYLGGRGYNEFLDYSLFAIKLNVIFNKYYLDSDQWRPMREAITNLLFDDRHDYWQNGPSELTEFAEGFGDNDDIKDSFWELVVDSMLECINVEGTEDVSVKFVIIEK